MKQSGLLKRQKAEREKRDRTLQDATRQTFVQYMAEMFFFALNDPEVMGKDVLGYARLKRVLDAAEQNYDKFFDALTLNPEADYARQKMDDIMRRIVPKGEPFVPFEERYKWLPAITYGGKEEGGSR